MTTADLITAECNAIKTMLLDKNARYGDSALSPRRIFSRADHLEQLKVRIDDKLSRIATMWPDSVDEDTTGDLIGDLVLLRIARRRARQDAVVDEGAMCGRVGPWQSAIPEQDVQRREQVATMGDGVTVYAVPPLQDGDDDPAVVHIVPDRTSRNATLAPDTVLPLIRPGELADHPDVVRARGREATRHLPDECLGAMCGRVRG